MREVSLQNRVVQSRRRYCTWYWGNTVKEQRSLKKLGYFSSVELWHLRGHICDRGTSQARPQKAQRKMDLNVEYLWDSAGDEPQRWPRLCGRALLHILHLLLWTWKTITPSSVGIREQLDFESFLTINCLAVKKSEQDDSNTKDNKHFHHICSEETRQKQVDVGRILNETV